MNIALGTDNNASFWALLVGRVPTIYEKKI